MSNREKSIDAPNYDPNLKHVPFPPNEEDYRQAREDLDAGRYEEKAVPPKAPLSDNYQPDAPAPDPSQTRPGATDIRDPGARLKPGEDASSMSPDVNLNLREPGDFD